ncbi:autophagy-related protein 2 [Selaginella moellendorffii]|uniref:autophagy-related protein 2 n=1 Tax=Selaginella moellendorffii TaxID=88036 RepID=UPI000D1CD038|nr:autophagy-related protein 2 [Selaginella moellendorffii]|eukprot:XP_024541789.1 autophagy-related protein 2 [Selaginella moellendorffii]
MVLQWATKRLCKFLLKRLNRFLNEEIDVEQLDVQLGSGTGTLTDLVLNVDYVNDQIKSLPLILKYGSIARIVVRLPCEIEVKGLELLVAPRQSGESRPGSSTNGGGLGCSSSQLPGISSSDTGVPTYLGVSDGVRIIGQMIKNLLLGLRVNVDAVTVGIEGNTGSESYVTFQVPSLKYGYEAAKDGESSNLVKVIEFERASVDVGTERKVRLLGTNGLSGSIQVTLPCKEAAALALSKIEFDISVEPVQLEASVEDVNHLVSVAHSYVPSDFADQSVYHDTSSFYESAIQGQRSSMFDGKGFDSFPSTSKSTLSVIADWMRKPEFSEPDLAASMDEFFECFDAWNQSATSSGIWNWTRSAFGAASVSDLAGTSQEIQMECSITARFSSLSATLLYDKVPDGLQLVFKDATLHTLLSGEESRVDADVMLIEATQLAPSVMQKQCFDRISQMVLPGFPISLHGGRGLKVFKVASSPGSPAVHLALKKYHRAGSGNASFVGTKVSLVLQPVVLWTDVDNLNKLAQTLDRVQASSESSNRQEEDVGNPVRSDCKLNLSVLSVRTFLTAANRGKAGFLLDVGLTSEREAQVFVYEHQKGSRGKLQSVTLAVTDGMLYSISSSTYAEVVRLRSDSQGKACVTIKWTENNKTGPRVARKIWDGIAATKKKHAGSGRHNFDYASATALSSDSTSATVELLTATSSSNVHISLPRLRFTFSDQPAVFELLACLTSSEPDASSCTKQVPQMVLTLEVREVQAVVGVSRFVDTSSKGVRLADFLQLKSSRLKLVAGVALGGDPGALYLHINLGEGEIREGGRNAVVCWKASAIGRGDGGAQNALSRGTAGLSMNLVAWPGNGQEPDVLVTGCMRGATIFTKGGNFDWVPAVVKFLEECKGAFQRMDCDQQVEPSRRPYFLFDLHDVALVYEPVGPTSSISCALAAAALRVSSGEVTDSDTQEYCISLRDLGLHLVDTKLRKPGDMGGASLQLLGFVQVAKSSVVGALVKLSSTDNPSYEVISADNQLNFDTCSDTIAAFGRLVADLQQLFAPDLQQTVELQLRTMKGKSAENMSSTGDEGDQTLDPADKLTDGLFEGLVENAFGCAKVLEVKQVECSTSSTVRQEASVKLVATRSRGEACEPTFIEDFFVMEHAPHMSPTSSQESETETSTSQHSDSESRGSWYQDSPVDVFDNHVPLECVSPRKNARKEANYPQALGRVILNGLKVRWRLYGGSDWLNARQRDRCVEVSVVGMDVQYDAFAPTGLYASSLLVEIHDVHVYDYSVDARWKLILGYYHKRSRPRESTSKAVVVRMDAVRPNPLAPLEEYRLSLALLPICLHLDQAHVDFFGKFFQSDTNTDDDSSSLPGANEDAILPFFQVCEMRPLIIRVDYIPRRLDFGALRSGNCFELFNMVSWKGVELHLKSVHTSGVYGWSSLMGLLLGEWLEDIFPRQVHKLLRAFGPIRPLYAVSSGAAKLIVFPAEQYKKDRRFLRGMRKGAVAFLQSISVEALGLGANLAAGVHHILLHTEMGLGGRIPSDRKDARRKFQPSDTREGFQQAYESLAQGLERTAISLVGNPVKVYQRGGGAGEALANAIKASPAAILAPASATADAVRHAFLGVRNG